MSLPVSLLEMVNNKSAICLNRKLDRWYRKIPKTRGWYEMATFRHSLATITDQIDTFLRLELDYDVPETVGKPSQTVAQYMNDFINSFSDVLDRDAAPAILLPVFDDWAYIRDKQFEKARFKLVETIVLRCFYGRAEAREYGHITEEFLFKWMLTHPLEMAKIEGVLSTDAIIRIYHGFWLNHLNVILAWVQKQAIAIDDDKDYSEPDDEDDDYFSR